MSALPVKARDAVSAAAGCGSSLGAQQTETRRWWFNHRT
jgi:hypothetical protein